MRNNIYMRLSGMLGDGETVDREFKALDGMMFVTFQLLADQEDKVACQTGVLGSLSKGMLVCMLTSVGGMVGRWRLVLLALRAAIRRQRMTVEKLSKDEGGASYGGQPE